MDSSRCLFKHQNALVVLGRSPWCQTAKAVDAVGYLCFRATAAFQSRVVPVPQHREDPAKGGSPDVLG